MSKNTSITLSDHFQGFIAEQVASGRFASASEIVREGLRLVEEREAGLKALQDALQEGRQSGPSKPFDVSEFLAEMHKAQP